MRLVVAIIPAAGPLQVLFVLREYGSTTFLGSMPPAASMDRRCLSLRAIDQSFDDVFHYAAAGRTPAHIRPRKTRLTPMGPGGCDQNNGDVDVVDSVRAVGGPSSRTCRIMLPPCDVRLVAM